MAKRKENICPVCRSKTVLLFAEIRSVLVHCNVLWKNRESALRARRGDLRLCFCTRCGHVFNTAFDPEEMKYSEDYENSLHFSPVFQGYARELAARLVERYGLYGKDIIEIGCGKGDFLLLLSELGGNRAVGFDASFTRDRHEEHDNRVKFIKDLYDGRYSHIKADMILSRQVLEHISSPRSFVASMRSATGLRPGAAVFCEVPNFMHTVRRLAIWDIIYEHYSYFTPMSLSYLFNSDGLRVERLEETFEGQFLCLEATPSPSLAAQAGHSAKLKGVDSLSRDVAAFFRRYTDKIAIWKRQLDRSASRGLKTVVWGSGSKGVSFLDTLKAGREISHVVDINPFKQGCFVPGTGQEIVAPEALLDIGPDLIIIMNPIYMSEIWETVRKLGLRPRILTA